MSGLRTDNKNIKAGALAGLIAGVVFGIMMGMLPMVAKLIGASSALFGFILHLIFSAVIGIIYALFLGQSRGKKLILHILLHPVSYW